MQGYPKSGLRGCGVVGAKAGADDGASSVLNSISALLIRESLPVVKFSELVDPPESCAVCLYEFEGEDEIRRLTTGRKTLLSSSDMA